MVSSKRFLQDEPVFGRALRLFVERFANLDDPVLQVTGKLADDNSKIAWTLLGTALYQDQRMDEIGALLKGLVKKYPGEKLWTLPVPKGGDIEAVAESALGSRGWSLFKNVAGIFWSVGFFVRRRSDLKEWVEGSTPEEMWRDLGEIYFMGKRGARPKACAAIYRLCGKAPVGLGYAAGRGLKRFRWPDLPLTMGARRFLSIMGPAREGGFADLSPEQKQKMMNEFCVALYPENPYAVAHSLQFYLEEGEQSYMCRECQAGCANCPVYEFCDYGVRES